MKLTVRTERWPYATPFRITNYEFTDAAVVVATLSAERGVGWGEAGGVYYNDETPASMAAQIEAVRPAIEAGVGREDLRLLLPPGGARNALDAALWDLEAKAAGAPVWTLAGTPAPAPLVTTFTISAGSPREMALAARAYAGARAIKLKLTDADPVGCVRAVRAARPDAWLGVDANQALDRAALERILPAMIEAGVAMIEQPVPVGDDACLEGLGSPIPLVADESAQTLSDLPSLAARYDGVNIKLDKCGGLTEGLEIAHEARRLGLKVMVGCMAGTSLSMAPAFVLAQVCDFVDLDAPTFLGRDRAPAASFIDGRIWCPPDLWGGPTARTHKETTP